MARTVFGHELTVGARADQKQGAKCMRFGDELETVRFPIGHRNELDPWRGTPHRLAQREPPLGAFLLFNRSALQALDLLLIAFLGYRLARPEGLTEQAKRYARGAKGQRVMHDQPALVGTVALADRPQIARLGMLAVGEKDRVLHHQYRPVDRRQALGGGLEMRRNNGLRARLAIVKQTIRRLRARPIPTGFVDRRGRGLRQPFRSIDQATIQAFVRKVDPGKFFTHPFQRSGAGLDNSLQFGIFALRSLRHAAFNSAEDPNLLGLMHTIFHKAAQTMIGSRLLRLAGIAAVMAIVMLSLVPYPVPTPEPVNHGLFSKDASGFGSGGHLSVTLADENLLIRLQSTDASYDVTTSNAIVAGEDYQVAFSFGPPGMKLYVNGVLADRNPFTGGLASNHEPVVIGALEWKSHEPAGVIESPFGGKIGGVDLYDKVLNDAEIKILAERNGLPSAPPVDAGSKSALPKLPEPVSSLALPEVDGIPASIVVLPHADAFAIDKGTLVVTFNWNGFEAPVLADEPQGINAVTPRGWIEHFIAYLITAAVIGLGMRARRNPTALIVALMCLSGLMEVLQHWSSGRGPSVLDFLASSLGAILGAFWAFRVRPS
jgi:hypothetical protein